MPHFKPNKTTATIIAISLVILSILLTRPETITKLPYNMLAIYKHYKIQYEIQKELKKQSEEYIKQHEERYQKMLEAHQKFEQEQQEREKLLSNDHYGGRTPEETLALFVEALKKKDYKLAAKYYLPWMWEEAEIEMKDWINNRYDKVELFLDAYKRGKINTRKRFENMDIIDVLIYPAGEDLYHYTLVFVKNSKTGIWKIEEF